MAAVASPVHTWRLMPGARRTTIFITEEQDRVLRARAETLGLSQSTLLREMLDQHLDTGGPPISRGWRAGFFYGLHLVMKTVNLNLHELQTQFEAGNIPVPATDGEGFEPPPPGYFNGPGGGL
jgi:hypothetical protein